MMLPLGVLLWLLTRDIVVVEKKSYYPQRSTVELKRAARAYGQAKLEIENGSWGYWQGKKFIKVKFKEHYGSRRKTKTGDKR